MDTLPEAAERARLTETLRRAGALGDGRVRDVAVESSFATILSRIVRLRLTYDGAATNAPASLILKTSRPERAGPTWTAGRQEVAFYTQIAGTMPPGLVPRCFEARSEADGDGWHLLLEDLTDSHFLATIWPIPPTMQDCERIMVARARFHAAWWDDPRLGASIGSWTVVGDAQFKTFAEKVARFADRLGDRLPPERRALYDRLIEAGPRLNARIDSRRNMTIVQGDAHAWNLFLPRDAGSDDVRFFDWDCWRIDVATDDLAYMMALHWYPEHRRRSERRLLDRYHAELLARGVTGYARGALADDYRLSVLWQIATPVQQAAIDIPPQIWWNHYERIFMAVDDLGCRDLL